jgi:hypothetical protein
MSIQNWFVPAVKIAAQALPGTAALSQWLDEIATSRIVKRLDRLEDPLTKYGPPPRIKKLTAELYSLLQKQSQDVPTTHLDWARELDDFKKEMRRLEADGLLDGSHRLGPGGEFGAGFRLSRSFIVLLTVLHGNRTEISKLVEAIETARTQFDGKQLRQQINLPLTVIDTFFTKYAEQGQGFKSEQVGASIYIPKP